TVALGLLIFEEFDHAPKNQERGPVVSEQGSEAQPGQHMQVAQQEDDADYDQNHGSGEGAAAQARWKGRLNGILNRIRLNRVRLNWARHGAPRRKKKTLALDSEATDRVEEAVEAGRRNPGPGA